MLEHLSSCFASAFHCFSNFTLFGFWSSTAHSKISSYPSNNNKEGICGVEKQISLPSSNHLNSDLHLVNQKTIPVQKFSADTHALESCKGLHTKIVGCIDRSWRARTLDVNNSDSVNWPPPIICSKEQAIEVISRKASLQSLHASSLHKLQPQRRSVASVSSNFIKVKSVSENLLINSSLPLSHCSLPHSFNYISETPLLAKLKLAVQYSRQKKLLILTVLQVELYTSATAENTAKEVNVQVRLALLAQKVVKFCTKYRFNAVFMETFVFNICPDELDDSVVRFRLYYKRGRSNGLLGEAFLKASMVDSQSGVSTHHSFDIRRTPSATTRYNPMSLLPLLLSRTCTPSTTTTISPTTTISTNYCLPSNYSCGLSTPIQPISTPNYASVASVISSPPNSASRRSSTVDDCGRFCSLPHFNGTPEVLISLCYVQDQSNVIVGVERAIGLDSAPSMISTYLNNSLALGSSSNKAPDTFLRISAFSQTGLELGKHKSETIKSSMEPNYNVTAVFQIALADLESSNMLIQVFSYCGILRRKVLLGLVCVGGENANSPDAQQHWQEMIMGMGTTVSKWHHLMKPTHSRN